MQNANRKRSNTIALIVILAVVVVAGILMQVFGHERVPAADPTYAGRYDLYAMDGLDGVDVDSYDYNYISLDASGKFAIKNKYNGQAVEQSGKWYVDGSILRLVKKGVLPFTDTVTEIDVNSDGTLTYRVTVKNGAVVTMLFKQKGIDT